MIPQRKQRDVRRPAVSALHRQRRRISHGLDILTAALNGFLVAGLLAAATGGLALLSNLDFGPPVGEVLTFGPYSSPAPVWQVAAVRAGDQRRCTLQPGIMARTPGSLVVEARLASGRSFRAHWAGGPTSDRASDCGRAVDLNISLAAMQTLVNAGFLGHQHWGFIGS